MSKNDLKKELDYLYRTFAVVDFLQNDPLSIPHVFNTKQDIEIAGFFSAMLAWGQRPVILNNLIDLMNRMDNAPYQFVTQHQDSDLKVLLGFVHRTFNDSDLLFFIQRLKSMYSQFPDMEALFSNKHLEQGMNDLRNFFFNTEFCLTRAKKHLSSPQTGSACKRINLFLRWMVRSPKEGLDFGIWTSIKPSELFCPLDVHSARAARHFKLLHRKQDDWKSVLELTIALRKLDPQDPVKYDFALFGYSLSGIR